MRRKIIPYSPKLKQLARNLRNNSTPSEVLLWCALKGKQVKGYDFHRQKPIDNFIVDFYCNELSLAIEVDGSSHDEKIEADETRQKRLEVLGVHILRFTERDVRQNLPGVVMTIEEWIDSHRPTPVIPSGGGDANSSVRPKKRTFEL
jgi:very-short-patch-repair endonuclease